MFLRLFGGEPGDWGAQALQVAAAAVAALEPMQAHNELASAWRLTAFVHGVAGRYAESGAATKPYIEHARKADNLRLVARACLGLANGILPGVTPVGEGVAQCEALLDDVRDRQVLGIIQCIVAQLRAMNGEFEKARALYRSGRAMLRDLGRGVTAAQTGVDVARVELLAGDLASAERELRADCDFLDQARGKPTCCRPSPRSLLASSASRVSTMPPWRSRRQRRMPPPRTTSMRRCSGDRCARPSSRAAVSLPRPRLLRAAAIALATTAEAAPPRRGAHRSGAGAGRCRATRAEARAEYLHAAEISDRKGDAVSALRSRAAAAAL